MIFCLEVTSWRLLSEYLVGPGECIKKFLSGDSVYSMPQLEDILEIPSLVDQRSGCCGFAAGLMAVLDKGDRDTIGEIVNCLINGTVYRKIKNTHKVRFSMLKRRALNIVPWRHEPSLGHLSTKENHKLIDFEMCIAIMLIFKHFCAYRNSNDWQECVDYSALFGDWTYELEIRKFRGDLDGHGLVSQKRLLELGYRHKFGDDINTKVSELSYRTGDLAVPPSVMPKLLKMLGLNVVAASAVTLAQAATLMIRSGAIQRMNRKKIQWQDRRVAHVHRGEYARVAYKSMIIGIGRTDHHNAAFQQYNNVEHWAYVPSYTLVPPRENSGLCWTWGREYHYDDMLREFGVNLSGDEESPMPNRAYYAILLN